MDPRYVHVLADALGQNPNMLDDYPHRYVFVAAGVSRVPADAVVTSALPRLFWCVETLEAKGWEPVAWDLEGEVSGVVMRRRDPVER